MKNRGHSCNGNTHTMGTYPQGELETQQWWSGQDGNDNIDRDRQNNKDERENINQNATLERTMHVGKHNHRGFR